jgi:hypothetical protein
MCAGHHMESSAVGRESRNSEFSGTLQGLRPFTVSTFRVMNHERACRRPGDRSTWPERRSRMSPHRQRTRDRPYRCLLRGFNRFSFEQARGYMIIPLCMHQYLVRGQGKKFPSKGMWFCIRPETSVSLFLPHFTLPRRVATNTVHQTLGIIDGKVMASRSSHAYRNLSTAY